MHAGYPMIDNMLTLLQANPHVYVDVAGLIWSYPIKEVNRHIERLVDAGFEDRVMFGTDLIDLAQADGLFDQHHSERRLPDAPTETRHPVQQRCAILENGCFSGQVSLIWAKKGKSGVEAIARAEIPI
jgi:predicted TIM-barrel fold metal-dependent hydrolase